MVDEKWKNPHNVNFSIKYNGKAVELHEMAVNDLAKSLLGLSGVLEQTSHAINGPNSNMFVKVKGSFKPGSFDVDIATFLTCSAVEATLNAINVLGFMEDSVKSLIWLSKKTKGEAVKSIKHLSDNNVEMSFNNCNNLIVVNNSVAKIYEDENIRKEFKNLLCPLEDEDMSDITFLKNGIEQEKIKREERGYFYPNNTKPLISEGTDYFLITQCNFYGKKTGWKFNYAKALDSMYDQKDFTVKILDNLFLKNVKNKKIIISNEGMIIKAKYRKTIQNLEKISESWEILKILDYSVNEYRKLNTHLDDF